MGYIYLRTNRINGKKYVGQATNLEVRQRVWNCLTKPYAGPAINAARAKYGIDAFDFEILKECDDKELDYWEKYFIKELNTKAPYGYNLTEGGGGKSGYTLSEETRKKMSEAQKGKHHSEETRKKIGENFINRKDQSKPVLQIDKITNEVIAEFPSVSEVKRQFGFSQGHISDCCLGKCKTHKGFIWKYVV